MDYVLSQGRPTEKYQAAARATFKNAEMKKILRQRMRLFSHKSGARQILISKLVIDL